MQVKNVTFAEAEQMRTFEEDEVASPKRPKTPSPQPSRSILTTPPPGPDHATFSFEKLRDVLDEQRTLGDGYVSWVHKELQGGCHRSLQAAAATSALLAKPAPAQKKPFDMAYAGYRYLPPVPFKELSVYFLNLAENHIENIPDLMPEKFRQSYPNLVGVMFASRLLFIDEAQLRKKKATVRIAIDLQHNPLALKSYFRPGVIEAEGMWDANGDDIGSITEADDETVIERYNKDLAPAGDKEITLRNTAGTGTLFMALTREGKAEVARARAAQSSAEASSAMPE